MAHRWREFPPESDVTVMLALQGMSLMAREEFQDADREFAAKHRAPVKAGRWLFGRRILGLRFRALAESRGVRRPSVAHEAMLIYIAGAVESLPLASDPKKIGMLALADGLKEVSRAAGYAHPWSMISAAGRYGEVAAALDDVGAACLVLSEVDPPVRDLAEVIPVFTTVNYGIREWPFIMRQIILK